MFGDWPLYVDTRISEALNDPVKEENDCWQSKSWYRNDSQYLWGCGFWRSFEGGWCEKRSQQRTDIPVKEEDVHSHEGILNSDSEDVSNPSEDGDSEEEWMVVNEKSEDSRIASLKANLIYKMQRKSIMNIYCRFISRMRLVRVWPNDVLLI